MSCDVNQLIRDSACWDCIPPGLQEDIQTYLFTQVGAGVTPTPQECDEDAQAFIDAAGITVAAQQVAICELVENLKAYPSPANSFWDSEVVIYPFVGGAAIPHSYNLKDPTQYQLTYSAIPPTHSAFGIIGDGANSYAITGLVPSVVLPLASTRTYCYFRVKALTAVRMHWGCNNAAGSNRFFDYNVGAPASSSIYIYDGTGLAVPLSNGSYFSQANGAACQVAYNGGAFTTGAYTLTARPTVGIYLLARNDNGVAGLHIASTISGFAVGNTLLTQADYYTYDLIWQMYQLRLGRRTP